MIRNFEMIRSILLQAEKAPSNQPLQQLSFAGDILESDIAEHLELMIEQKLIDGEVLSREPLAFGIYKVTWSGHDFLENARNDTLWKKVMSEAKSKGTSMTLVVLNGLLSKAAEKYAGLT